MKAVYVAPRDMRGNVRLARRPIAEVMSKPAVTVAATALLDDALKKMLSLGLRHLAVVDDDGRCLGMLSDRTIAAAWAVDYYALMRRTVFTALDLEPAVLSVHAAVLDAARLMRHTACDAVAVINAEGRPIGVVTGSDLVSLLAT
jgi:CBS domain-containing protein